MHIFFIKIFIKSDLGYDMPNLLGKCPFRVYWMMFSIFVICYLYYICICFWYEIRGPSELFKPFVILTLQFPERIC